MADYAFRVRFLRSTRTAINIESARWEKPIDGSSSPLVLSTPKEEGVIRKSGILILAARGWASSSEADGAAAKYADALTLTLARLRVGADSGTRGSKGVVTSAGLALLEARLGQRCLNDVHGRMVYEAEPPPKFVSSRVEAVVGIPQDRFERVFSHAIENPRVISDQERISLELFNSSFFQEVAETRFLTLVMAVEALLSPIPRSGPARAHVQSLIQQTEDCDTLSASERESLLGSLRWLLEESINCTGRRLAETRLGNRLYDGVGAKKFFSRCYSLRSRLVHGKEPFPTYKEVNSVCAQLEVFVSDLLAGELLNVEF